MAFYEFAKIDNLSSIVDNINSYCEYENIRGTVILAPEGINGTLAGFISSIDKFAEYIASLGFRNLNTKYSLAEIMPFYREQISKRTGHRFNNRASTGIHNIYLQTWVNYGLFGLL